MFVFRKQIYLIIILATACVLYFTFVHKYNLGDGYYVRAFDVYYKESKVKEADFKSFKVIKNGFAQDRKYFYYKGFAFEEASFNSLQILSSTYCRTNVYGYVYNKNGRRILRLPNSDGSSFKLMKREGYANDKYKVYYFDGKDFYIIQKKGFSFIDNNKQYNARDENHYYKDGHMVGITEEFQKHLNEISSQQQQKQMIKKQFAERKTQKISYLVKAKRHGAKGQEVSLCPTSTIIKAIQKIFVNNEFLKPQRYRYSVEYKIFQIIKSPFNSRQYVVLYGLDKDKSFNNCCDKPTGIFVIENGKIIWENNHPLYVDGDYNFGGKLTTYFDYNYIDDVVWADKDRIIYDVLIYPGNSQTGFVSRFQTVATYKSVNNDHIFDVKTIELLASSSFADLINSLPKPIDPCLEGVSRDDVSRIIRNFEGNREALVVLGKNFLPIILVTDRKKIIDLIKDFKRIDKIKWGIKNELQIEGSTECELCSDEKIYRHKYD